MHEYIEIFVILNITFNIFKYIYIFIYIYILILSFKFKILSPECEIGVESIQYCFLFCQTQLQNIINLGSLFRTRIFNDTFAESQGIIKS